MYSRSLTISNNKSFFLFGPRGTGKSQWIRDHLTGATIIDLLESDTFFQLSADPSRICKLAEGAETLVIDEIQKVPALLDEVHRLIELKKIRCVLTGSNGRKLRRSGGNLLAGRALTKYMFPLTAEELGKDFDLQRCLKFGCLPAVFSEPDPVAYLQSYVKTYLKEEIEQEGLARNLGSFARFLENISLSQATVVNVSNIARQSSINRNTVEDYISILEDLLLAYRLPVFTKRAKREMTVHQKFLLFDVGIYRTIRPRGPLDLEEEIDGAAIETIFFQQLYAINSYHNLGFNFFHWRTRAQQEVDFVLYGEHGLFAFEIKRASRLSERDTSGLKLFGADYPEAKLFCLYTGERSYRDDSVKVLPIGDFICQAREFLGK